MEEVQELFKKVASNKYSLPNERRLPQKKPAIGVGTLEVDRFTNLEAPLASIAKTITQLSMGNKPVTSCGVCQGENHTDQCHLLKESVNYINNFNPRPNFNQSGNWRGQGGGWRDGNQGGYSQGISSNPNNQWRPNPPPGFGEPIHEEKRSSLEETVLKLMVKLDDRDKEYRQFQEETTWKIVKLEENVSGDDMDGEVELPFNELDDMVLVDEQVGISKEGKDVERNQEPKK
ncbi:OLC1v1030196C1, partial [Oldenlandia corymbosa var. corymbosa]